MLIENMFMAFHAIKANKMRAFLTMRENFGISVDE